MIKALLISISLTLTLVLGSYLIYDYKCTKGLTKEVSIGLMFAMMGGQLDPITAGLFKDEVVKIHYGRQIACGVKNEISQVIPQSIVDFLENE